MKRFALISIFIGLLCINVSAQTRASQQVAPAKEGTSIQAKMNAIQGCEELNIQLTELFGKNYSITNPKVLAQLQKNIADVNASRCIRKKSLYGVYGEDYVNHLDLINNGPSYNNQLKNATK
ncbi:MAG: hypothetical protein IPK62_01495 [Bacteroidetes bacterium]|nr:hypothetical protein [Bacteroidota bacterium]MBK8143749.1 hypothetical protein [Bacteroidota bacterium]